MCGTDWGERVSGVELAQPGLQLVVEPLHGLHRREKHLLTLGVEQKPPQLLDVVGDEVEQRLSGQLRDVAFQSGDGGLAAPHQLASDGRIGFDVSWHAREQGPGWLGVRQRPEDVVALEDGPQRVRHQGIRPAHDLQEAGAARGEAQPLGDVDEQSAAGLRHGGPGRQLPEGQPEGLHRVGHHLLMTDGEVDVELLVTGLG